MNRPKLHTAAASIATGLLLGVCAFSAIAAEAHESAKAENMIVYIGTYTRGASEGIYLLNLNTASGELTKLGVAKGLENPSFLAIHPDRTYLYAVSEIATFDGGTSGAVAALAINQKTGRLRELNRQPTGGAGPCHLVVDHSGKSVLVANYGGGSIACLPIQAKGRLGRASTFIQHEGSSINPRRQQGPHAHSIHVDPANRFVMAADLGLDKVLVYRFDARRGSLVANDPPAVSLTPGSGPRHFAFHPNGRFAYTNLEISSSVTALLYDADRGVLSPLQAVSTLPASFEGNNSTAEVQVHPSGKFLYVSNRGHDSIAAFAIDQKTGKLTFIAHQSTLGKTPRNFGIDPSGRWLLAANQATDNVVVLAIDPQSGRLTPHGTSLEVPTPVCVKFLPLER